MTCPTLSRAVPLLMATLALMILSGCAQSSQVAEPIHLGPDSGHESHAVRRSRLPRLLGEELDLASSGVASQPARGVTEVGLHGPMLPSPSSGQAKTLREATRLIVPTDYAVRMASCVDQQAQASWSPNITWIEALRDLMQAHGLAATVDHDLKQVLIDRPSTVNPNEPRDWVILRSDVTLRRALERWLAPACVQMEWDVAFPLDVRADRTYRGVNLWTALRTLAEELELSDAPIQIIRYPNAVRIASGQLR